MSNPSAPLALQTRNRAYLQGVVLVLLAGTVWSTAGVVVRAMEAATGWQIIFYRSAALIPTLLVLIALRNRGRVAVAFRAAGWTGVVGGFCLSLAFTGFIFALIHTTVANALFILSSAPLATAVLAWLVLREPVERRTRWAIAWSIAGVAVMVGASLQGGGLPGNLAALLSALGFAGFTVALRRGREADMLPAVCLAGVFALLIAGSMVEELAISRHDLALCLALGVLQIGLGLALYTLGSRHIAAAELTILSMTEVLLGPIWVWLAFAEIPGFYTLLGGAIVLSAVTAQALGGIRRKRPPLGLT